MRWRRRSRLAHLVWALLGALSLVWATSGCNQKGQLVLRLDLPGDGHPLNPFEDPRLDTITLIAQTPEGPVINTVPFSVGNRTLDLGDVPVSDVSEITLIGRSASSQIIAYGRGDDNASLSAFSDVEVIVPVRRPLTYIAGGTSVLVFDTSQASDQDLLPAIRIGNLATETTNAVATTPDGRFLVVAVKEHPMLLGPGITLVETKRHDTVQSVALGHEPKFLSVSRDGRWAVVTNPDEEYVAVVDLEFILMNPANAAQAVREISGVTTPSVATFVRGSGGEELAVVLQGRVGTDVACPFVGVPSQVAVISLVDARETDGWLLPDAARDIAARPEAGEVFVALPCLGRVSLYGAEDGGERAVAPAQVPTALIVHEDIVYVGSRDISVSANEPSRVVVTAVDALSFVTREISAPMSADAVPLSGLLDEGTVLLEINPFQSTVFRLSIDPGAARISALVIAHYQSPMFSFTLDGQNVDVPPADITSRNYVGLDSGTGDIRRRYRTQCEAEVGTPAVSRDCRALPSFEQPDPATEEEFRPLGITTLYGVP